MRDFYRDLVLTNYNTYDKYYCSLTVDSGVCYFTNDDLSLSGSFLSLENAKKCEIGADHEIYCTFNNTNAIEINQSATIYTNISTSYPSIIADIEYQNSHNLAFNLTLTHFYVIAIMLCLPFLISYMRSFFRLKGADM